MIEERTKTERWIYRDGVMSGGKKRDWLLKDWPRINAFQRARKGGRVSDNSVRLTKRVEK